jgi:hypothetical protein
MGYNDWPRFRPGVFLLYFGMNAKIVSKMFRFFGKCSYI